MSQEEAAQAARVRDLAHLAGIFAQEAADLAGRIQATSPRPNPAAAKAAARAKEAAHAVDAMLNAGAFRADDAHRLALAAMHAASVTLSLAKQYAADLGMTRAVAHLALAHVAEELPTKR